MSKRFFGLCLTTLLMSNIYFYNFLIIWENVSPEEIYLGKFLNQSIHILLFVYIALKKNILLMPTIKVIILTILGLDFLNEALNILFMNSEYSSLLDSSIVVTQRILWSIIFIKLGGRLVTKNQTKNILNLAFATFMIYSFTAGFGPKIPFGFWVQFLHLILFIFVVVGSNTEIRYFQPVGLGALFVALGDLAFIYSGFHDDYKYRYLPLFPRFMIMIGELMILFVILQGNHTQKYPNLENQF